MALDKLNSDMITDGTIVDADVSGIASSKLTGALPAISGTNLTSLPAANLSGALPAISGAALTGVATDVSGIRQDILTLALHSAVTDNKAAHNLPTAFIDQFEDDTGLLTQTTVDRNTSGEYVSSVGASGSIPTVRFDGTNDLLSATAGTHGLTDSKVSTLSFWVKKQADGAYHELIETDDGGVNIRWNDDNKFRVRIENSTGTGTCIGAWTTTSTLTVADGATHILISWDTANDKKWILFDGVAQGLTINTALANENVDLTDTMYIGSADGSGSPLRPVNSDVGQFYWANVYTDLDVAANVAKFYSSGAVDFGADGSTPSGTQPQIFLNNATATWQNNLGSGGNFTEVGALTDGDASIVSAGVANATGTLISNVQTAPAATTSLSGVFLYTDATGTATIGTDLKIYMSANNGTNFTEAVSYSTAQTFSGSIKMVKLGKTTVTSGTQVKLKAVWANQVSGSKVTRLDGWAINY